MAGKKRKHGGGSAAAHAKAQKKKAKQHAVAAAAKEQAQQQADAATQPQQSHTTANQDDDAAMDGAPATASGEPDILSAELREELGGNDGDVMVIVGKKVKKPKQEVVPDEILQQAAKMSKSKRRKLEQLAARKVKEARREDLYKSLEATSLSNEQLNLMVTTAKLGHKETLRERLKRSMNRVKAGISLSTEDARELLQQRDAPDGDSDGHGGEESSGGDSSDDERKEPAPGSTASADDASSEPTHARKKTKKKKKASAAPTAESAPAAPSVSASDAKGEKPPQQQQQKKKRRAVVVNHIVPQRDAADAEDGGSDDGKSDAPSAATETETPRALAAPQDPTAPRSTSQNDAMARLEALRKKNEERRRQKELEKRQPKASAAATTGNDGDDAPADPANVYVPTPIVLKTSAEMKELSKQTHLAHKTTLVQLKRKPEIQLARMQLPVCSSEQEIMEAITDNDVVILCGETGSGKTTQVPQFLYEAGYGHPKHPTFSGRIGVTQPRRVAAVSTAKRVAEELNVGFGATGHVGYQIRYDAEHVGDKTRIKFMTDGILLKEIQQDFLLRSYSILLLDEAHERNVNTDILIGLLSRIAPLRAQMAKAEADAYRMLSPDEQDAQVEKPIQPLKLVVMSATLRVEDFTQNTRLFPTPPPVLRVNARQYPVTVHFNKRTELDNYVDEAFKKVVKIHKKLPEGGVLVFLTGQREILQLARKLRRAYSLAARESKKAKAKGVAARTASRRDHESADTPAPAAPVRASPSDRILREHDDIEEEGDLEDEAIYGSDDKAAYDLDDDHDGSENDSDESEDEDEDDALAVPYMHVLPLYSLMPNDEQMRVFEPPPEHHRLIVVATNVAETSLTIPGIKYVVDAGRTKERVFDLNNGISSFDIQWISKASADQRAGRAGRTGPGHCYRLYSSAVYDTEFAKFSAPEILCQPIEDLVLQMKAMGIHNVLQFPFPTPPDRQAVKMALLTLSNLGAITGGDDEAITALGHVLVKFPVAARFAKMLLLAKELHVLEYTIAIVAGLSGHSPFIHVVDRREKEKDEHDGDARGDAESATKASDAVDDMESEWREAEKLRKHAQWFDAESDVLSLLRAAGAYAYTGGSSAFCHENHLHEKTMQNMLKLRQQLTRIVNALYATDDAFEPITLSPRMAPPDHETQVVLRQIVAAGFVDQVAKRAPAGTIAEGTKIERNCAYIAATASVKEPVYIHPHSSVFTPNPTKLPPFVVYQHIMRTTRAYMKMVTAVEPAWLASIGKNTPLCKYSEPLAEPSPFYCRVLDQVQCFAKAQYGVHQWTLPVVQIAYPEPESDPRTEKDGLAGKYRWFAKFLLDGVVVPGLLPFASMLKEPSHTVIRKKFDKKIQLLVAQLQKRRVGSRAELRAVWRNGDATFLRAELKAWIKDDRQALFTKTWASVVKQETSA